MIKTESRDKEHLPPKEWKYPILLHSKVHKRGEIVVLALSPYQAIYLVGRASPQVQIMIRDWQEYIIDSAWTPYDGEVIISND